MDYLSHTVRFPRPNPISQWLDLHNVTQLCFRMLIMCPDFFGISKGLLVSHYIHISITSHANSLWMFVIYDVADHFKVWELVLHDYKTSKAKLSG